MRVVIDLTSAQSEWQGLGDGYRVSVRIVTLSEDAAVQVPVSAVFPLPAGAQATAGETAAAARHAVFVVDGGRARQVAVELVARNGSAAWIRVGLRPGQQVIVYPPPTVREGCGWRRARSSGRAPRRALVRRGAHTGLARPV